MTYTTGFGDTEGRDTEHIFDIVAKLHELGHIHAFLLVRSGNDKRIYKGYMDMFHILQGMFGVRRRIYIYIKFFLTICISGEVLGARCVGHIPECQYQKKTEF